MKRLHGMYYLLIALSGCVADSAMRIHGVAPINNDCEIQLINSNNGEIVLAKKVSGEFSKTLIWGAWPGHLDLVGTCDGVVTKTIKDWQMPRKFSEELEVGDISP